MAITEQGNTSGNRGVRAAIPSCLYNTRPAASIPIPRTLPIAVAMAALPEDVDDDADAGADDEFDEDVVH